MAKVKWEMEKWGGYIQRDQGWGMPSRRNAYPLRAVSARLVWKRVSFFDDGKSSVKLG
jgi:hypothetical protein